MSTSLTIDISEEIKCPICLERMKKSKILPCQHTGLSGLFTKLNNSNTVDCPECQRQYKITPVPSGVKGFPENRLMKFHEKKKSIPKFFRSFFLYHLLQLWHLYMAQFHFLQWKY